MKLSSIALIATAAAGLAVATSAFAAGTETVPTQRVSYADLDLRTSAGVDRLYSRLRGAAEDVCGRADFRNLKAKRAENACIAGAVSNAVKAVENAGDLPPAALARL